MKFVVNCHGKGLYTPVLNAPVHAKCAKFCVNAILLLMLVYTEPLLSDKVVSLYQQSALLQKSGIIGKFNFGNLQTRRVFKQGCLVARLRGRGDQNHTLVPYYEPAL